MAADDSNTNETTGLSDTAKSGRQSKEAKRGGLGESGKRGSEFGQNRSARSSGAAGAETGMSGVNKRAKQMMNDAGEWAEETTSAIPRLAKNLHLPSPSLPSFNEANPLVMGAVGLGLGVIIGALLPRNMIDSSMQGLGMSSDDHRSSRSRESSTGDEPRSSNRSPGTRSGRGGSGRGKSRKQ